jgi:hypothetical protein
MTVWGGDSDSLGVGERKGNEMKIAFLSGNDSIINRFIWQPATQRWRIIVQDGKSEKPPYVDLEATSVRLGASKPWQLSFDLRLLPRRCRMPVSAAIAESNRTQTERLRKLVQRLDSSMLAVRLPNGWTVAGALAHLAFWDRMRRCLMRRWAAGDMCSGGYDGDLFNATAQPLLEMIPTELAAKAAVRAAEEVDALLLEVSDELVETALSRPDAPNLDRGSHRQHHLDVVERALAEAGYA